MIPSPSARRAAVDRWIISLTPLFKVVQAKAMSLRLGEPMLDVGPNLIQRTTSEPDKIRKGTVWWVRGKGNCGFHVDFEKDGLGIDAWTGRDRVVSLRIAGKVTEDGLKKDLKQALVFAGLTDLARTEEVRESLFSARVLKAPNAL